MSIPDDYWICACVKRDAKRNMTHIKANPPRLKKCRVCGQTQAEARAIKAQLEREKT